MCQSSWRVFLTYLFYLLNRHLLFTLGFPEAFVRLNKAVVHVIYLQDLFPWMSRTGLLEIKTFSFVKYLLLKVSQFSLKADFPELSHRSCSDVDRGQTAWASTQPCNRTKCCSNTTSKRCSHYSSCGSQNFQDHSFMCHPATYSSHSSSTISLVLQEV